MLIFFDSVVHEMLKTLNKRKTNGVDEIRVFSWVHPECGKELSGSLHTLFTKSLNHRKY